MNDEMICASRGPRVQDEGCPRCKLLMGHAGTHRSDPDDGWGSNGYWGDPINPDLAFRDEWFAAGFRPMSLPMDLETDRG